MFIASDARITTSFYSSAVRALDTAKLGGELLVLPPAVIGQDYSEQGLWNADAVNLWRAYLVDSVKGRQISQRKFWSLYEYLAEPAKSNDAILGNLKISDIKTSWSALLYPDRSNWQLVDRLDLSARDMRWIIDSAIRQLENRADFISSREIAVLLHLTLAKGVSARGRRQIFVRRSTICLVRLSVRDRVLNGSIHTGISPPSDRDCRPAVGWAFVLFTISQQVENETIQRQENLRNLSDAFRERRSFARLRGSPRTHSSVRGRSRVRRRGHLRNDISLEKCA
ncbi:MAG: hypothetical protein K2X60_10090 [Xanthobacteraceae bacterium]|nr:hypothetical protein [Xanthobacteraceae bacterium]